MDDPRDPRPAGAPGSPVPGGPDLPRPAAAPPHPAGAPPPTAGPEGAPAEADAPGGTKRALDKRLRALEKLEEAEREEKRRKEDKKAKKNKDKEKETKKDRSRGVETMFRSAYRVNMDLSALADSKANMLVSVTGLLISIILGTLAPGLDTNPWLRLPTAVFLLFLTAAFVFGVLASRPRVESRHVTLDEVRRREANLLFFGHFANMPRDEFVVGMRELMEDPDALYHSMAVDLYGVGTVLQKKYRLLRISFTVLLVGMGLGVALFVGTIAVRTPIVRTTEVAVPIQTRPSTGAAPLTPAPTTPSPTTPAPTDTAPTDTAP